MIIFYLAMVFVWSAILGFLAVNPPSHVAVMAAAAIGGVLAINILLATQEANKR